jgi:hypothetical protein
MNEQRTGGGHDYEVWWRNATIKIVEQNIQTCFTRDSHAHVRAHISSVMICRDR